MNEKGWISLHRRIQKNWVWNEKPFTKGQAWIDILLECNHEDERINIKNELIICKRGESVKCLKTWADRWGWNKSKVRRFLTLLETDTMIERKPTPKTTHLKVINYDTYQNKRNTDETQMKRRRNADETQMTLNNNKNNKNKTNKNNVGSEKTLNSILSFADAWEQYPRLRSGRRAGSKKQAQEQFRKHIDSADKREAFKCAVAAIAKEDPKYVKHFFRWIRDGDWENYTEDVKPKEQRNGTPKITEAPFTGTVNL